MGADRNKLLLEVEGKPVIIHTLEVFEKDVNCRGIILAIHPNEREELAILFEQYAIDKVIHLVDGGKERQQSVHNALKKVSSDIVLVHDGARPFIQFSTIQKLVQKARVDGAAIAAVPVKDTIKVVRNETVDKTIERSSLWSIQTPQAFRLSILNTAYDKAELNGFQGTDDASLVEQMGEKIQVVEADYDNIKLTTKEDLIFAEAILKKRRQNNH